MEIDIGGKTGLFDMANKIEEKYCLVLEKTVALTLCAKNITIYD